MLRPNKIPRGPQAFTLLEVMMAATVLLLAIMGMIQVVISGSEMLDFSRKQTIATQIIRAEIESLSQKTWTTVSGYSISSITVPLNNLSASSSFGYPELITLKGVAKDFVVVRKVERVYLKDFPADPPLHPLPYSVYSSSNVSGSIYKPDMRSVTFTVTWTGNTGRLYSRSGSTYFGKNGVNVTFQRS